MIPCNYSVTVRSYASFALRQVLCHHFRQTMVVSPPGFTANLLRSLFLIIRLITKIIH